MLVLTRKAREQIVIGNNIKVTIVKIEGQKVRIGIDAPDEVAVHRQEIADSINSEESLSTAQKTARNQRNRRQHVPAVTRPATLRSIKLRRWTQPSSAGPTSRASR